MLPWRPAPGFRDHVGAESAAEGAEGRGKARYLGKALASYSKGALHGSIEERERERHVLSQGALYHQYLQVYAEHKGTFRSIGKQRSSLA